MPKIKIDTNRLNDLSTKTRNIKNKTNECQASVGNVINRLDWQVSSKASINTRLNKVQKRLQRQTELIDAYTRALETTSDNFCSKDKKLKQDAKNLIYQMNGISAALALVGKSTPKTSYKTDDKIRRISTINALFGKETTHMAGSFLWTFIKEAGHIGKFAKIGEGFLKVEKDILSGVGAGAITSGLLKQGFNLTKTLYDINKEASSVGAAAKILSEDSIKQIWRDKVLGLTTRSTATFSEGLKDKFGAFVGKDKFGNRISGAKGAVKAGFAWAGVAVEGAVNYFKYDEKLKKGEVKSEGEKWTKTVTATLFGTAKSLVIGAAVTAVLPAATWGVAVAGITGITTVAVDAGSKALFGKGVTDLVTDGVWDIGKTVVEKTPGIIANAGNALKNCFNGLANCFNNPKGQVKVSWAGSW